MLSLLLLFEPLGLIYLSREIVARVAGSLSIVEPTVRSGDVHTLDHGRVLFEVAHTRHLLCLVVHIRLVASSLEM